MKRFSSLMPVNDFNRIDEQEELLNFVKRHDVFKEISALHSKSRAVIKMNDYINCENKKEFNKIELGILHKVTAHWFLSVDIIREYYGDEIAIYFAWMNFF